MSLDLLLEVTAEHAELVRKEGNTITLRGDEKGYSASYEFDDGNRLIKSVDRNRTGNVFTVVFEYDSKNRLARTKQKTTGPQSDEVSETYEDTYQFHDNDVLRMHGSTEQTPNQVVKREAVYDGDGQLLKSVYQKEFTEPRKEGSRIIQRTTITEFRHYRYRKPRVAVTEDYYAGGMATSKACREDFEISRHSAHLQHSDDILRSEYHRDLDLVLSSNKKSTDQHP